MNGILKTKLMEMILHLNVFFSEAIHILIFIYLHIFSALLIYCPLDKWPFYSSTHFFELYFFIKQGLALHKFFYIQAAARHLRVPANVIDPNHHMTIITLMRPSLVKLLA